jgi:L-threonylcarbamoyladenylate synthase
MITQAVSILRRGGLVAFPTETVYGLGADATNPLAVRGIFAAKGRPSTNPLIVHVASVEVARRYATHWRMIADQLAARFWPGPLTLVLPKTDAIVAEVSAGLSTVGLRVPNHPLALELLRDFDGPIAAPSANRSNHISPTQAAHVRAELGDRVDLILDGGPCSVGIESTVLDVSGDRPRILRPGGISQIQIESIIGPVEVFAGQVDRSIAAVSPGQHERHYSPRTQAFWFSPDKYDQIPKSRAVVMAISPLAACDGIEMIRMPGNAERYARELYRTLRELDERGFDAIYIQIPPGISEWDAVRDRIRRASVPL